MAIKKVSTASKLNKQTDALNTVFKVGRKKVSFAEAYKADKSIYSKIEPTQLNDEDRSYYNKVKAGKARAANGIKNSSGKYADQLVSQKIQTRLKKVAKIAGFENIAELKKNSKELYEATLQLEQLEIISTAEPEKFIADIDKFSGKIIRIKGDGTKEEVSKSKAINVVQRSVSHIRNKYDVFFMSIEFSLKNEGQILEFVMPTPNEIDEQGEDVENWEYDSIEIYESPKPVKKNERDTRKRKAKTKKTGKAKKSVHRR
jgi:hypothetical protein